MTKIEAKFMDWVQKRLPIIVVAAVTVIGVLVRLCGINFQSGDFNSFLFPWWTIIQSSGVEGLSTQVGNYNIPYQIITYLLTLLPLGALYSYKLLSIIFDFALAASAGLLVYSFTGKSRIKAIVTYSLVLCSLTVILNSSFWGQCDSIYVTFILLSLYFLKKDRPIVSFVMLGLSFAFKLQMIFILPFFLYYYARQRRVSILHFLIIPAVDIIMCLPALLLGRSFGDIIGIYLMQTDYGKQIYMNYPNLYALMCNNTDTNNYYLLKGFSILLTVLVLGLGLAAVIHKKSDLSKTENFLLTAIWTAFTCLMFLSSMHERYGYLLDVLVLVYALTTTKRLWLPLVCQLISLRGYCFYLFTYDFLDIKIMAVINTAVYALVTAMFVKEVVLNTKTAGTKKLGAP